jgi:hypothetical protein
VRQRTTALSCVPVGAMASETNARTATPAILSNADGGSSFFVSEMMHFGVPEPDATLTIRSQRGDFVRQHCKARGVTIISGQNPHIARFAYIDIPLGTVHGTILSCCHPVCIASGRRFRYCAHCNAAVAKRNFNRRHAHGNLNSPPVPCLNPKNSPVCNKDCTSVQVEVGTSIPTIVSIKKHEKSVTSQGKTTIVALGTQELEIIKLLRCRPSDSYPQQVAQWLTAIRNVAENELAIVDATRKTVRLVSDVSTNDDDVASFGMDGLRNVESPDISEG